MELGILRVTKYLERAFDLIVLYHWKIATPERLTASDIIRTYKINGFKAIVETL